MTDADAFLGAIRASPDDDVPRLAYADWLEEHGQQAYAEFVRLSCRLARDEMSFEEKSKLGHQRYKLWKQVLADNAPAFSGGPLIMDHFPRGVCRPVLSVEASFFVKTSAHWWPLVCPRELTLNGPGGYEQELARAVYLSRVSSLRLACRRLYQNEYGEWVFNPLGAGAVGSLAGSPHVTAMSRLVIDGARVTAGDLAALRDSPLCGRLTELYIDVSLDDGQSAAISASQTPPGGEIAAAIDSFLAKYRQLLMTEPLPPPPTAV